MADIVVLALEYGGRGLAIPAELHQVDFDPQR